MNIKKLFFFLPPNQPNSFCNEPLPAWYTPSRDGDGKEGKKRRKGKLLPKMEGGTGKEWIMEQTYLHLFLTEESISRR